MTPSADAVAESLLDRLAAQPEVLDRLIDQIAERVANRISRPQEATKCTIPELVTTPVSDDVKSLAEWAVKTIPEALTGDPKQWSEKLILASGKANPRAVLEWAYSDDCPTAEWRSSSTPIGAPNVTDRGSTRRCRYTQMLDEYQAATAGDGSTAVAGIDQVIATVCERVAHYGLAAHTTVKMSWRRNALDLIRLCDGDPAAVGEAITWAMRAKAHWRSNIQGVPSARTFRKLLADYRAAGGGFQLGRDGGDHAGTINEIAHGWAWYMTQVMGRSTVTVTTVSQQRVWQLLTGRDGSPPVPVDELKDMTRWVLDTQADRARFYTDGEAFPPPHKARKALVDMATSRQAPGSGVEATNRLAGDTAASRGATTVAVRGV